MEPSNSYVFDIYEKMFETPAWKDLIGDLKVRLDNLSKQLIHNPQVTEKDLYRVQGIVSAYNYLIGLEPQMEAAKKQLEEDKGLPDVQENTI